MRCSTIAVLSGINIYININIYIFIYIFIQVAKNNSNI